MELLNDFLVGLTALLGVIVVVGIVVGYLAIMKFFIEDAIHEARQNNWGEAAQMAAVPALITFFLLIALCVATTPALR